MEDTPMTIYIKQGLDEAIMLEVKPSDVLADVKKKLIEAGGKVDKYTKFIANGRVVREDVPLQYQGSPKYWVGGPGVSN